MKYFLLIFLFQSGNCLAAEVFKCVASNGAVSYTNQACEKNTTKTIMPSKSLASDPISHGNGNGVAKPFMSLVDGHFYRVIGVAYVLMSLVCYFSYRKDKAYAQAGSWRISEQRLHVIELFGGWPGGLIAQSTLRHKNRKLTYQLIFWFIVCIHVLIWLDYFAFKHYIFNQLKKYLLAWM